MNKSTFIKGLLIASSLFVVTTSHAANFSCNPLNGCNDTSQPVQAKTNSIEALAAKLNLSQEQNLMLYKVVIEQIPQISDSKKQLEEARTSLFSMAVSKQYDESAANQLAETIAKSSAHLAILQAQREFEILSILTPEQAKQYAQFMQ
jgi:Spy/CpxP family protein refolding chaperone